MILGVGVAELADDAVFELELVAVKIVDDEVKSDEFLPVVDVETVSLEDGGAMIDDSLKAAAHGLVGFGLAVLGVDTDGESDAKLSEGTLRNLVGKAMNITRSEVVGDLDVNGAYVGVRAVIMKDEIIGAVDFWEAADEIVKAARKLRVAAAADDVENGVRNDVEAGFDDEEGDEDTEEAVETEAEEHGRENAN